MDHIKELWDPSFILEATIQNTEVMVRSLIRMLRGQEIDEATRQRIGALAQELLDVTLPARVVESPSGFVTNCLCGQTPCWCLVRSHELPPGTLITVSGTDQFGNLVVEEMRVGNADGVTAPGVPDQCTCPLPDLMAQGCRCGATK